MSLEFSTEVLPDHIQIKLTGEYAFGDLMKHVEIMKAAADAAGRNHMLIDARTIEGRMTESEKFFVGSHIAEVFGIRLKVAVLAPSGHVTKLGEMAAVNRGARFMATECQTEAIEWLLPPKAETRP